jgi:hypothetical protein
MGPSESGGGRMVVVVRPSVPEPTFTESPSNRRSRPFPATQKPSGGSGSAIGPERKPRPLSWFRSCTRWCKCCRRHHRRSRRGVPANRDFAAALRHSELAEERGRLCPLKLTAAGMPRGATPAGQTECPHWFISSFFTALRNEQIGPGDLNRCTLFDAAPSATSCRYLGVRSRWQSQSTR